MCSIDYDANPIPSLFLYRGNAIVKIRDLILISSVCLGAPLRSPWVSPPLDEASIGITSCWLRDFPSPSPAPVSSAIARRSTRHLHVAHASTRHLFFRLSPPLGWATVVIGLQESSGINFSPGDDIFISPPPSPIAQTSPQQHGPHTSPDHAHLASKSAEPSVASYCLPFTLDNIFESKIVVLHCPKNARREIASVLNSIWCKVLNNANNIDNWIMAFAVAKLVLFLPPGKKKTFKDKAATVKHCIKAFQDGHFDDLWRQATHPMKGKRAAAAPWAANNARRATLLAQEGQFGQAAKALLSHGLYFDSQEAIDSMRAKHPSPPPPPPDASPYSFTATETLAALNSFHSLSAGGASGCRAAHLRESVASERGNALLSTMTRQLSRRR